ncbi:hypothetical protein Ddye_009502 [Dipteronia dyeriana]|uniref:Uncharacterized protein n=1 Tax=Dipteronia dyeriana TaxID=168575 RepID=A0AAD9XBS2_9ROSI|nr:hypothetical protein Ddye_009502 [Dipteronia dyeriana]
MTYEELVSIVQTAVKYNVNKFIADLQSISIIPGTACRTFIRNDDDVLFMLGEDRVISQLIPLLVETPNNFDRQAEATNCSQKEVGTNNIKTCVVSHRNEEEEDEEPIQTERHARRVHICSSSVVGIAGTSEVRPNITEADSDNAITKNDLKRLVGHSAMRHNFEWKVKRSNKTTLHLVCLTDNCMWKLRAVMRDEMTYFQEIHRRHRQASAIIIGEVAPPRLQQQDGRLMRPKDIIVDMKTIYGIQIMCNKAYQALDYALSLTYGTHEEIFQLLPSFGYVLEEKNPGTITDLQCDEDGKFLYFFMSLGASLRGFRRCLFPVIAVDDTNLKVIFGGTMFVATVQDGNEQIYLIAFGFGDSENNLS